jgi:glycerol kinase
MENDSGVPLRELRVDGGAARNDLLMQIQADLLGVPVTRPANPETTVLGSAYLAGLAVGYWPNGESIAKQWQAEIRFSPTLQSDERMARRAGWAKALERAKGWETH